jgi:flagellum-specific peptidoglycan hydrolase FlgJ
VHPVKKPTWQQATALVSLSTCGAMTGFAFAHGTVSDMTSPARMPVHLLALKKPAQPASASDSAMRSAIVNVASYYLRMAQTKSPAEMETLIWGRDSVDAVDHGESCAAFASLTLALGAQATGQESWVTGGTTYPWPLQPWADVRVDPNPDSPGIISVLQDAQAHNRWHPLGDGYQPQPGDWVLFDGHVEVVTRYSAGVLYTIGGDSSPNLSVNAHTFAGPLGAQGVTGFVNNGELLSVTSPASDSAVVAGNATAGSAMGASAMSGGATGDGTTGDGTTTAAVTAGIQQQSQRGTGTATAGQAAVPGTGTATLTSSTSQLASPRPTAGRGTATVTAPARGRSTAARKGAAEMVGTAGETGGAGMQSAVAMPGLMAGAGMAAGNGTASTGAFNAGAVSSAVGETAAAGHGNNTRAGTAARTGSANRAGTAARTGSANRAGSAARNGTAGRTGNTGSRGGQGQPAGAAAIPGLQADTVGASGGSSTPAAPPYTRNSPPTGAAHVPDTSSQQAFISLVAPGALAAQSRYGVPAAVTIAQAIDESGWGQSALAIRDNNLFGIKGAGPAGSDMLPTQEFENGQWVTVNAAFRVYHNVAESIADHGELLATGPSYQRAMADRNLPDAFATDLTGIYATDPQYGSNLIAIMRLYNLYRYDTTTPTAAQAPVQNTTASPGVAASPGLAASPGVTISPGVTMSQGASGGQGAATIPGVLDAYTTGPGQTAPVGHEPAQRSAQAGRHPGPRVAPRRTQPGARRSRYVPQIPQAVTTAFITSAKAPLSRAEPLYDDVASHSGIRWELLAACDWMQCQAQPRHSPVHGEKLGAVNGDGTAYRTKSEALAQCAGELIELAMAVYWIDITARRPLPVRDLAKVFAAFRWGGLLKLHGISAMEFPYAVEGLTAQHTKMRWPDIKEPNAPDKPGTRFRMPFGAVPVMLCLGYPALA